MKQRITGLDLQIITPELVNSLLNYRLQNIYNLSNSNRQYLLKFSIPDSKKQLVVDCGNKLYLTDFERPVTQAPSTFVTKLRKHLKSRRLSAIKQVTNDRIIVFQFSDGLYYLVFEFFSAGNILLLDQERKILSLQRTVREKGDVSRYAVNETYALFNESFFADTQVYQKKAYSQTEIEKWVKDQEQKLKLNDLEKKAKILSIHKLLFVNASHLSSELILKHVVALGLDPKASCFDLREGEAKIQSAVKVLNDSEAEFLTLTSPNHESKGVIVSKINPNYNPEEKKPELEYILEEFHPFKPYKDHEDRYKFTEIEGYNKTLDSFFSTIESTKYALKIEQQKLQAANRLDHARSERDKQIQSLVNQQELSVTKADAIIHSMDLVESCREFIISLVNLQMDWTNMESLIKLEKSRGHHVAKTIKLPLNLKENKINLLLPNPNVLYEDEDKESASSSNSSTSSSSDSDSDYDSDDSYIRSKRANKSKKVKSNDQENAQGDGGKLIQVWVDLTLSAFSNASLYFDSKKNAETKMHKVEEKSHMALKNAERKINQDLSKNLKNENDTLKQIRLKYWFEKFFWFVSSEGYLCLAGRDPSQTDMIYYRYFNDNDCFVSSDIDDSLKVFVKNPFLGEKVPPSTLSQAGIFALSASNAWNAKITTSAWVLDGSEISKKDYDNSLLPAGTFTYKADKSYLPPSQLVMGLGFYWIGDDDTTSRYRQQRLQREELHGFKIVMDNRKKDIDSERGRKTTADKGNVEETKAESESGLVPSVLDGTHDEKEGSDESNDKIGKSPQQESFNSDNGTVEQSNPQENKLAKKTSFNVDDDIIDPIKQQLNELKINKRESSSHKPPNVRGKKAKMKKIAKKYADQDEEEKKLRMAALGTLKQKEEAEIQKLKEKDSNAAKKYLNENALRRKKNDEREYRKYIMEESNSDENSATNYLEILDSFISRPEPRDIIADVIPVFAPWPAFNKFKYKIKVQPGAGKKGKSINDALNYFTTRKLDKSRSVTDVDWEVEREMLKTLKANDLIANFTVSKVKLALPDSKSSKDTKAKKKK
ncbi:uncharacterized protein PRCAT00004587001 [Priceomyces carsonii]|uniref:uncharacterized protein n=1 Tax=Priceomyces carsonii TaxID=28549 RepID=UPI002EDA61BB|nr:unnamed protein product [Priceomyces carsonii]